MLQGVFFPTPTHPIEVKPLPTLFQGVGKESSRGYNPFGWGLESDRGEAFKGGRVGRKTKVKSGGGGVLLKYQITIAG